MKILLDTNIVIPAEPTAPEYMEPETQTVASLIQLLAGTSHESLVHPATREELLRDRNPTRRHMRQQLLAKYRELRRPPPVPLELTQVLGTSAPGSHDAVDLKLLAALHGDAVDLLVTHDQRMHTWASRLGLAERVMTASEALAALRALEPRTPAPPPAVSSVLAYELNEADPIFTSFRQDYPQFDDWLAKCKLEHRQAWIVSGRGSEYAGIAIVNPEAHADYGLGERVLKLCTFKVSERHRGLRIGELLLGTVLKYAFANRFIHLYVTVLPKYTALVQLIVAFGFLESDQRSSMGELVFVKPLDPNVDAQAQCFSPLDYHVRYGPYHARHVGVGSFIVPIRPEYHAALFPDASPQASLFAGRSPFGNALRKAYLCHSPIRKIAAGDLLYFYASRRQRAVTVLGVAEETFTSRDPAIIARRVAKRTVYRYAEIEQLCESTVLAILFRKAWVLSQPVPWKDLAEADVLGAPPQSIVELEEKAATWLSRHAKPLL